VSVFHSVYRFIYSAIPDDVEVIDMDLVGNSKSGRIKGFSLAFFNYLYNALRLLCTRNKKIFIREYNNYALSLIIFCSKVRKCVYYLNINHNVASLQQYMDLSDKLSRYTIIPVMFEYSDKLNEPPAWFFPVFKSLEKKCVKKKNNKIRVGVIGAYRKEKKIESILSLLYEVYGGNCSKFDFILGSDVDCRFGDIGNAFSFIDTSLYSDYSRLMCELDVAIISYGENYFFRTSGVLSDVVRMGVVPIVPNYPVFRNQVEWPTRVGYCYDDYQHVIRILDGLSLSSIENLMGVNFPAYYEGRSIARLKLSLNDFFEKDVF